LIFCAKNFQKGLFLAKITIRFIKLFFVVVLSLKFEVKKHGKEKEKRNKEKRKEEESNQKEGKKEKEII